MKKALILLLTMVSTFSFAQISSPAAADPFSTAENEVNAIVHKKEIKNFWDKVYVDDQNNRQTNDVDLQTDLMLIYKSAVMFNKFGYPDSKELGMANVPGGYTKTYQGPWVVWRHCSSRDILDIISPMITEGITKGQIEEPISITFGGYLEKCYGISLQFNKSLAENGQDAAQQTLEFLNTKPKKIDLIALRLAIRKYIELDAQINSLPAIESWTLQNFDYTVKYKIVKTSDGKLVLAMAVTQGYFPAGTVYEKNGAYYLSNGPESFFFSKKDGVMCLVDASGNAYQNKLN